MVLHIRQQQDALLSTTNCRLGKAIASHFRLSRGAGRHTTIKCSCKEVLETNQKQETKACIPKRIIMQRPRRQSDLYNAIPSENQVKNHRDRSKTMGHKRVRFQEQKPDNVVRVINTFSYEDLLCIVGGFFGKSSVLQLTAFLNRSAQHLDYSTTTSMWQLRLTNSINFTSNDAKRWRRLAHYDWDAEDEIYLQERRQPGSPIRAKFTNWLHRRRESLLITAAFTSASQVSEFKDLSALVNIVNGCITVGSFQFDRRSILLLCNYQGPALGGFLTHN